MGDISGLDDRSNNFANFLTVARKFNFTSVYVFHTVYPSRSNWQMIISQRYLTFFQALCKQHLSLKSYLRTVTDTLINTFHTETFGSIDYTLRYQILPKKKCLTIHTRDVNNLGLSKFRTSAENDHQQICYFNHKKKKR